MMCPRPIVVPYQGQVPCGQCMSCRINVQRSWAARIMIEALSHQHSLFVTLTYAPEKVPVTQDLLPTLWPPDLTLFWKRLRKRLGFRRLRYFACGEYGDESWRPHYHAVVFGLAESECVTVNRYVVHPAVQAAWGLGFTSAGSLTNERAAYVAQYVVKKMGRGGDERVQAALKGRYPEFQRASRKPGIGALHVEHLAEALSKADPYGDDVPTELVMPDGRRYGMPSFLAQKMRYELGMERLASRRPPRPKDPEEFIEIVSGVGVLGVMTRRVPRSEQLARETEAKLARKAKRKKREKLTHGQEEAEAFKGRRLGRDSGSGEGGSVEAGSQGRLVRPHTLLQSSQTEEERADARRKRRRRAKEVRAFHAQRIADEGPQLAGADPAPDATGRPPPAGVDSDT